MFFLYLDRLNSFMLDLVFIYIIDNTKNNKGKHFRYFVERIQENFLRKGISLIIFLLFTLCGVLTFQVLIHTAMHVNKKSFGTCLDCGFCFE